MESKYIYEYFEEQAFELFGFNWFTFKQIELLSDIHYYRSVPDDLISVNRSLFKITIYSNKHLMDRVCRENNFPNVLNELNISGKKSRWYRLRPLYVLNSEEMKQKYKDNVKMMRLYAKLLLSDISLHNNSNAAIWSSKQNYMELLSASDLEFESVIGLTPKLSEVDGINYYKK